MPEGTNDNMNYITKNADRLHTVGSLWFWRQVLETWLNFTYLVCDFLQCSSDMIIICVFVYVFVCLIQGTWNNGRAVQAASEKCHEVDGCHITGHTCKEGGEHKVSSASVGHFCLTEKKTNLLQACPWCLLWDFLCWCCGSNLRPESASSYEPKILCLHWAVKTLEVSCTKSLR